MKRILLAAFCFFATPLLASHIVGGEFEIIHLTGNQYRVSLIVYFDELNGDDGAKDVNFTAAIFRKRDNVMMQTVYFGNRTESNVAYTQPECSNGEIVTTKLVYTTTINLSDSRYNDPEGYYIIWERCCRNYTITNIYSNDPAAGQAAGQTFYLEFPPVVKDGEPFYNSSPRLFPPLNDYACPNKPYYVDFAGVDDDGDSLAYSLVTPLSTHSIDAIPPLGPRPYPEVKWREPFSLQNILAGKPDMRISADGFLTATPTQQGLFVFAVKCEEFRDGVKIGEVRRDFQMLVVDACPQAEPPQILGKKLTDATFTHDETMSVTFNAGVADADRCINVQVSDPDASKVSDNFQERIRIKAIPIGFKKDVRGILPSIISATLVNGSVKTFQICFDKCPYVNGPFQVGIVAYDDACSLPLFDTLKVMVNIEPPPNTNAYFTSPGVTEQVNEGDKKTWPIVGVDDDGDQLILGVIVNGFRAEDVGMKVVQVKNENGRYEGYLEWDTRCDVYDFSRRTEFDITLLLEDIDECNLSSPDVVTFKLKVKLPGNGDPVIDSNLTPNPFEREVGGLKRKINEKLKFNVTGTDPDIDYLVLGVRGKDFDVANYNVSFPAATGKGSILAPFEWNIFCDNVDLSVKDEFTFQFIVVDNANKCRLYKADTLDVTVELFPPDNQGPDLLVANLEQAIQMVNNSLTISLGQQVTLGLSAVDRDVTPQPDWLKLNLINVRGTGIPEGYIFAPAEGRGSIQTTFTWKPDCSLFADVIAESGDDWENEFTFTFNVVDDRCWNEKGDTVEVNIKVRDVDRNDDDFLPPNIITPNGDGLNDFFAMVKKDEITGALVNILPLDNCSGKFDGIVIYNRWGKQVFSSADREFRWHAEGESAGEYFYLIKYSDKNYKGIISIAFSESESAGR